MTIPPLDVALNSVLLQEKLQQAAHRSRRDASGITVLAVTKNVPIERIEEAWRSGLRHFGENRVQEAENKLSALRLPDAEWHLIGHLQTNKAKRALEIFHVIESVDSLRLARHLERCAAEAGRDVRCFIEIKVSPEPTKQGLLPDELEGFLDAASEFAHLKLEGLMTVAPYDEDPEKARPYFRRTRELLEKYRNRFHCDFPRLSMGMSHDFEVAVEEGSHLIRIGTALFGQRQYSK